MTKAPLPSEAFFAEVLGKSWVPLNDVTQTDFILEGGITLALRRPASHKLVIEIVRMPEETKLVLPFPNESISKMPGEAAMRRILTHVLKTYQRKGLSVVDQSPPVGLTEAIGQILFLAAEDPRTRRVSVLAPTEMSHVAVDAYGISPTRQEALWLALQPLLALVPSGGSRFTAVTPGLPTAIQNYDLALIGNSFTLTGDGSPTGPVERMIEFAALRTSLASFNADPEPIIRALEA